MATRLISGNKVDPTTLQPGETMPCCPINIGRAWRHLFIKGYFEPIINTFIDATKPCQYGCREPGRGTELALAIKAMLDGTDGFMVASVDVENGYNEIKRKSIIVALWECGNLRYTFYFFHKILSIKSYIGLGGGANVLDAPFTCDEG
eukprot:9696836-Ditylum_brightwellii.AAC.1